MARTPAGASGIRDLAGERYAAVIPAQPNTNVIHPRTLVPTLLGRYPAGRHLIVTAVFATAEEDEVPQWHAPPELPDGPWFASRS
jgi:hypothetical protein